MVIPNKHIKIIIIYILLFGTSLNAYATDQYITGLGFGGGLGTTFSQFDMILDVSKEKTKITELNFTIKKDRNTFHQANVTIKIGTSSEEFVHYRVGGEIEVVTAISEDPRNGVLGLAWGGFIGYEIYLSDNFVLGADVEALIGFDAYNLFYYGITGVSFFKILLR